MSYLFLSCTEFIFIEIFEDKIHQQGATKTKKDQPNASLLIKNHIVNNHKWNQNFRENHREKCSESSELSNSEKANQKRD